MNAVGFFQVFVGWKSHMSIDAFIFDGSTPCRHFEHRPDLETRDNHCNQWSERNTFHYLKTPPVLYQYYCIDTSVDTPELPGNFLIHRGPNPRFPLERDSAQDSSNNVASVASLSPSQGDFFGGKCLGRPRKIKWNCRNIFKSTQIR